jgi:uncharacterized protein (TIGR02118 family)
MIKLVFALRRRDDVDPDEFHRYWRDEHGPLVQRHAAALGVRRYVQHHRLDSPVNDALRASRDTLEPFDGTAELWWDDINSLVAGSSSPEGLAAAQELLEDERRFIDLARSTMWIGEEVELVALG